MIPREKRDEVIKISDLSILVEHAYDLVDGFKNVPPVKVGHARLPVFLRTVVQEVKNVVGGELSVLQAVVHEVHHCRVSQGVLQRSRQKWSYCM